MRQEIKSESIQQQYQFKALTPNPHRVKSNPKYQFYRCKNSSKARQSLDNKLSWSKQKKDKLQLLMKQNNQLRKQIVELKINQFYQFDDKKLKQLLMEIESLKKEIKKYKDNIYQLELENQFLKRSNNHLKMQLQKDIIEHKKKQNHSIDSTKCTNKNYNSRNQESIMHLTTFSSNFLNNLEDDYQHFKSIDKHSPKQIIVEQRKKIPQKAKSPYSKLRRQVLQQPNEYLLYRRKQKAKNTNN